MLTAMVMLVFFPVLILSSVVIGIHFGEERKIGFWWTFFFCISLSPLVGIVLALVSPSKAGSKWYTEFVQTVILFFVLIALIAGIITLAEAITTSDQPVLL